MQRRQFLGTAAGAALALSRPQNIFALDANNPYRKEIGIQLYTLRIEINEDVAGTLKAVADGYSLGVVDTTSKVRNKLIDWDRGLAVLDDTQSSRRPPSQEL